MQRADEVHYSDEIADEICERLGDGQTLTAICKDDYIPHRNAVFYWVDTRPAFATMYATARVRQAEKHYDDIVQASRDVKELTDTAKVQAYRVYIDTMKWAAARLRPDVYAERTNKTITVDVGQGYAALLEQIDARKPNDVSEDMDGIGRPRTREARQPMIDVTPVVVDEAE